MADEKANESPDKVERRQDPVAGLKVDASTVDPRPGPQPAKATLQVVADDQPLENNTHLVYYSDIKFVEADYRLDFERAEGPEAPPATYRAFRKQIEDVARVVRILFQDDRARLTKFFGMLHITATSGLVGPNSNLDIGTDNLQDVKDAIADEFPAVRGKIWWWNFGILVAIIAICTLATIGYRYYTGTWPVDADGNLALTPIQLAVALIPLGVVIGLFVEFIFRVSDDIPYEQLRAINPGRWKPFQRTFNTVIVGYIFAGILGIGAFKVGVGSILLNDFIDKTPMLSLVIGFISGFAFPFVRDLVQQFRPERRDASPAAVK